MKKLLNKPLFTFLLGAIIFGTIAGVSALTILANNVDFTPRDDTWNVDKVNIALDDLYQRYLDVTDPSMEVTYVCSVEGSSSCSGTSLDTNKVYFCVTNARSYNGTHTITGAQVLLNQENGGYLDYKYTTYRSFIKPIASTVTFSVSNTNGIGVVCYHIINGD